MQNHLKLTAETELPIQEITNVLSAGKIRTPDIGGSSTTSEVTDAVIAALR